MRVVPGSYAVRTGEQRRRCSPVSTVAGLPGSLPVPGLVRLVAWVGVILIGFMGMRAGGSSMGPVYSALVLTLVCRATVLLCVRRDADAFAIVAFLAVTDPLFRSSAKGLPYLTLPYAAIVWGVIVLYNRGSSLRFTLGMFSYCAYGAMEIAGLRFDTDAKISRGVLMPSLGMVALVLAGHCLSFGPQGVKKIVLGFLLGSSALMGHLGYLYATGGAADWGTQSNFHASGGAGPVQMSFVLAVCAFTAFWGGERSRTWLARFVYGILCMALLGFMLLTFSRGGLYIFTAAVMVYIITLKRPSLRSLVLLTAAATVICVTAYFAAEVTDGAFQRRYGEVKTTRVDLVMIGWEVFGQNAIVGVGTGGYYAAVEPYFGVQSGAHNEVIRAAAEHGILGLVLWLAFFLGSVGFAAFEQRGATRALHLALLTMFLGSVFHNGLKLLMQPLIVALAFCAFPDAARDGRRKQCTSLAFGAGRSTG